MDDTTDELPIKQAGKIFPQRRDRTVMYEYRAQIDEVVDGDTIDVVVDLGFNMQRKIRLRLAGIDTDETYGVSHDSEEYARGIEQTQFVDQWIANTPTSEWPFIVRTKKKGKFGRYIATIERADDNAELTEALLSEFDGIEY